MNDLTPETDPRDGYRAVQQVLDGSISLWIETWQDGQSARPPLLIYEWEEATAANLGQSARVLDLLQAYCRFLNSGGKWDCAEEDALGLRRILVHFEAHCPPRSVAPGWQLVAVSDTGEYTYRHERTNQFFTWNTPEPVPAPRRRKKAVS